MKREILNCLSWLVNQLAQGNQYYGDGCWGIEFCKKESDEAFKSFYESLEKHIDFNNLTADELRELRFKRWDEDSNVWLFPLWLVPLIPDNMEVFTIGGNRIPATEVKSDLDTRFGCVAFGILPKKEDAE